MRSRRLSRAALAAAGVLLLAATGARAVLSTPGFRAVGVAHSADPISALAVAPDGRMFVAIQAKGQTVGTTPGTAEIRVYGSYATGDGAVLDQGTLWATVDGVRATTSDEGLLGIALAPDFATSKLLYAYLTTTDESVNQHVRVYRENAAGTGDYLGTVATSLEPPVESANRSGGPLAFGPDGCLYVGVGDNGSGNRWNAQLLVGTDPIQSSENTALCTNVCLGSGLYPARTVANDGMPNHAGKVLRLAVEGASPAIPGPAPALAAQPYVFGAGMRFPAGLAVHPLTGQLFATERGDTQEAELDVVDAGSDMGWPCLEGDLIAASGVAACMAGHTPADVYANHPAWRRPLVTHLTNPTITGAAAYTGLGYPEDFYGDVFYLLRQSARIYRVDLTPPCFLPAPAGAAPLAFHDATDDDDFSILYDFDDDGNFETVFFTNLVAIAVAPNPLGQRVLYVAGRTGISNALTEDSAIFRIEYATAFTPYGGPLGRVPDSCFGGTGYDNPFLRVSCLPPGGPCPGQPDGTACDDGDPCNGTETCQAGICQHGAAAADGTACGTADGCHTAGTCQASRCVGATPVPDGTACAGGDPCESRGACTGGVCQSVGGPEALDVHGLKLKRELHGPGTGALVLAAGFHPSTPVAPQSTDTLTLEIADAGGVVFSASLDHPASDPFWKKRGGGLVQYLNRGGTLNSVALRHARSGAMQANLRGRHLAFQGLDDPAVTTRLRVGPQCFTANLAGRCTLDAKKLRCR